MQSPRRVPPGRFLRPLAAGARGSLDTALTHTETVLGRILKMVDSSAGAVREDSLVLQLQWGMSGLVVICEASRTNCCDLSMKDVKSHTGHTPINSAKMIGNGRMEAENPMQNTIPAFIEFS